MNKVLLIGAGGVGSVVAHKCAMVPEVFGEITLASRTLAKCDAIAASVKERTGRTIATAWVDADDPAQTAALIRQTGASLVINVALPYQDLSIMEACLAAGADYLDTANYEPPDVAKFEYSWQWNYQDRFKEAGLSALLGSDSTGLESIALEVESRSVRRLGFKGRAGYHPETKLANPMEYRLAAEYRPPLEKVWSDSTWQARVRGRVTVEAAVETRPQGRDLEEERRVRQRVGLRYRYRFWDLW